MGEAHQLRTGFDRNPEAVARATGEHGDGRRWGQSLASSVRGALSVGGEVPTDAPGDPRGGILNGIPGQVRVSGGRLNLGTRPSRDSRIVGMAQQARHATSGV